MEALNEIQGHIRREDHVALVVRHQQPVRGHRTHKLDGATPRGTMQGPQDVRFALHDHHFWVPEMVYELTRTTQRECGTHQHTERERAH